MYHVHGKLLASFTFIYPRCLMCSWHKGVQNSKTWWTSTTHHEFLIERAKRMVFPESMRNIWSANETSEYPAFTISILEFIAATSAHRTFCLTHGLKQAQRNLPLAILLTCADCSSIGKEVWMNFGTAHRPKQNSGLAATDHASHMHW